MAQGKQQNFGAAGLIFENLMSEAVESRFVERLDSTEWVRRHCANWAGRGTKSAEAPFPLIRSAAWTTLDARH